MVAARRAVRRRAVLGAGCGVLVRSCFMSELGEAWITRHTNYFSDPNAGADELLNDATEWLHHAHCTLKLITELADEWRSVDVQRLAIVLQGLAGVVEMGMRCAAQ